MNAPTQTLLRNLDSKESKSFEAGHAKRLLAYPRTRWAPIEEEETETAKPRAAARKAVAAADSPAVDPTGHPTEV